MNGSNRTAAGIRALKRLETGGLIWILAFANTLYLHDIKQQRQAYWLGYF